MYRSTAEGADYNRFAGVDLDTSHWAYYETCTTQRKVGIEGRGYRLVTTVQENRWLSTLRWNGERVRYEERVLRRSGYSAADIMTIKYLPPEVQPELIADHDLVTKLLNPISTNFFSATVTAQR